MTSQHTPPTRTQAAPKTPASSPAATVRTSRYGQTSDAPELLEALDDAMFAAIAGQAGSLEKARALWTDAVVALPWDLIDESREQYLRYAFELAHSTEPVEIRSAEASLAALEVIELLTRE